MERPKIESEDSTSSEPEAMDPFLTLPSDVLSKIIANIPVAKWPSLELLDTNFRASTLIAWRQLRSVNLERDFTITFKHAKDQSSFRKSVKSILQKLIERSPFLSSMSGIDVQSYDEELNSDTAQLLAQFEHLQSITVGKSKSVANYRKGLENIANLIELTHSRSSLKELHLYNVVQCQTDRVRIIEQFASSFASGREIQSPLKLEKFSFTSSNGSFCIRLDTLDTSRLTDLRVGNASIEPQQLTNLIERASNLHRIELSFLRCHNSNCNGPRLRDNTQLLTALALREHLATIKASAFKVQQYSRISTFPDSSCSCCAFGHEFMEMLKAIGCLGKLTKLALKGFAWPRTIMNDIFATICNYIPSLQSIRIDANKLSDGSIFNIGRLTELEEIHFTNGVWGHGSRLSSSAITKIAQLPQLKRLALDSFVNADQNTLECLATLTDLRIVDTQYISADVFDKWSNTLASDLQILMLGKFDVRDKRAEEGLVRLLEKAVGLRVLILDGKFTDQLLVAIIESCPKLEILGVKLDGSGAPWSPCNAIMVRRLQEAVYRCPNLKKLGGFDDEIRKRLRFPKYRKIGKVDTEFWNYDFDDSEYA